MSARGPPLIGAAGRLRSCAVLTRASSTRTLIAVAVGTMVVGVPASCDTDDGRQLDEPTSEQRADMPTSTAPSSTTVPSLLGEFTATTLPGAPLTGASAVAAFTLTTPWADGAAIDVRFTCDGEGRSPTLMWTAPPAGTVELVLLVTDDDADGFIHHAVAGIPPMAGEVGEGGQITGASEGVNSFGAAGWGGPCPPSPGETHTYRWTMYALAQQSELPAGFTAAELQQLAIDAGFASAQVTGTYTRAG